MAFHERDLCGLTAEAWRPWYRLAIAELARGDTEGYRRACTGMIRRFGNTPNAGTASNVVYACTACPLAGEDGLRLVALGQRAARLFAGNERACSATLYRAGAYASALTQFEVAAKAFRRRSWDWLFLAMIRHRLGDAARARQSYE